MASVAGDFTIASLSGDATTDGKQIDITATASAGTLLHTAVASTDYWDYVSIWLVNRDTIAHTVTVQWGGTTAADSVVIELGPGLGPVPVFPDGPRLLRNSHVIRAYCDTTAVVSAYGEVHTYRVTV